MPLVSADIPNSLRIALDQEIARLRMDESAVVTAALSNYLGIPIHTLFQVSISGALVAGVYDGEVSVRSILQHGDFGLGTFANLDGEVALTNEPVYQGQPILAVAAVDELTAADAIEKIVIEFQPLPFVVDPLVSLRPGGPNARTKGNYWNIPAPGPAPAGGGGRGANPPRPEIRELKWTDAQFAEFKEGRSNVLVATDVAARGIHIDDLGLVVHFDPPADSKVYSHRSGRTARAGATGTVLSLVEPQQHRDLARIHAAVNVAAASSTVRPGHPAIRETVAPAR